MKKLAVIPRRSQEERSLITHTYLSLNSPPLRPRFKEKKHPSHSVDKPLKSM